MKKKLTRLIKKKVTKLEFCSKLTKILCPTYIINWNFTKRHDDLNCADSNYILFSTKKYWAFHGSFQRWNIRFDLTTILGIPNELQMVIWFLLVSLWNILEKLRKTTENPQKRIELLYLFIHYLLYFCSAGIKSRALLMLTNYHWGISSVHKSHVIWQKKWNYFEFALSILLWNELPFVITGVNKKFATAVIKFKFCYLILFIYWAVLGFILE
jgi:hypothetical protein